MATIRDPNFWKRFSTAVHQDDLAREEANQAGVKHTYVTTISLCDDNITMASLSPMPTPTSPTHVLSSSAPKFALHPQVRYSGTFSETTPARPVTAGAAPSSHSRTHSSQSRPRSFSHSRPLSYSYPDPPPPPMPQPQPYPQRHSSHSSHTHSQPRPTTPTTPPPLPQTTQPTVSPKASYHTSTSTSTTTTRLTKPSKSHPKIATRSSFGGGRPRSRSNPFTRHGNNSQLTLGLSGRPQSRFKFWTSVSADPSNRNSWLENQQRKARQRTYICWGFWLVLIAIVGGVIAAVLVLKNKGII